MQTVLGTRVNWCFFLKKKQRCFCDHFHTVHNACTFIHQCDLHGMFDREAQEQNSPDSEICAMCDSPED